MEAGRDGLRPGRPSASQVKELEEALARLPDVSGVRVVADANGRPLEVHVLAGPGKRPKQVVRDVQSVAMAAVGLRIDRRIVSVVQLDGDGSEPAAATGRRPVARVESIRVSVAGLRALVEVVLGTDDYAVSGFAEGSIARAARPRLIALATLDALHQDQEATLGLDVEGVRVANLGGEEVAVVTLSLVGSGDERLVAGAAVVDERGIGDAIARAVIDIATSST